MTHVQLSPCFSPVLDRAATGTCFITDRNLKSLVLKAASVQWGRSDLCGVQKHLCTSPTGR